MRNNISAAHEAQLTRLRELSGRIGCNPLLTQANTGNTSIKLGNVLWIKASGKWLADARHQEILIPLDLKQVTECLKRGADPAEVYAGASIETAMHAVLPHAVVLHVHSVNTIAWAVRQDAHLRLASQLDGLRWHWVPYMPSGLPLAREIARIISDSAKTEVFILGNHGLVIAGDDCDAVEDLLFQVEQRLAISPRPANMPDYCALDEIAGSSSWNFPEDDDVHALGTDPTSRAILSGGILYPCQSIFSNLSSRGLFHAIPCPASKDQCESRYHARPFLIIEGRGVIVRRTMTACQRAIMSGLAHVVQRINSSAPVRYLSEEETSHSARTISRYQGSGEPLPNAESYRRGVNLVAPQGFEPR